MSFINQQWLNSLPCHQDWHILHWQMLLCMISSHLHCNQQSPIQFEQWASNWQNLLKTNKLALEFFDCTLSAASFNSLTDTTFAEGSTLGAADWKSQNNFFTLGSSHDWNAPLADIVAQSACASMAAVSPGLNGISIPWKTWVVRSVCFSFFKSCNCEPMVLTLILPDWCFRPAIVTTWLETLLDCAALAASIASSDACLQGPVLPFRCDIKSFFSPLIDPADVQA